MQEIINLGNIFLWNNMLYVPEKYNRMWGVEYILMDSKHFMGGSEGTGYETIIDMFLNIRNVNNSHAGSLL